MKNKLPKIIILFVFWITFLFVIFFSPIIFLFLWLILSWYTIDWEELKKQNFLITIRHIILVPFLFLISLITTTFKIIEE